MRKTTLLGRLAPAGAAALGCIVLISAIGPRTAGRVHAQSLNFPILNAFVLNAITYGTVQLSGTAGSAAQLSVTLQHAQPDSTYAVAECQALGNGAENCVGDATRDSIVTNDAGAAQATLTFPPLPQLDRVKLVNVANATDAYIASIPSSPFTALNQPVSVPAPTDQPNAYNFSIDSVAIANLPPLAVTIPQGGSPPLP